MINIVGSSLASCYLAHKLAAKGLDVTINSIGEDLAGSLSDYSYPKYGLRALSEIPDDLQRHFALTNIPSSLLIDHTPIVVPFGSSQLKLLGSDDRQKFDFSKLSVSEICDRYYGSYYTNNILVPIINNMFGVVINELSPVLIGDLINYYFEFSEREYCPVGGYSSVCDQLIAHDNIRINVMNSVEDFVIDDSQIVWNYSPQKLYDLYLIDTLLSHGFNHEDIRKYLDKYKISDVIKFISISSILPESERFTTPSVRTYTTGDIFEVANYRFTDYPYSNIVGYVTSDDGYPIIPFRTNLFDNFPGLNLPKNITLFGGISKFRLTRPESELSEVDKFVTMLESQS